MGSVEHREPSGASNASAPAGVGSQTVTVVLTDVEGSTRLWVERPDVMSEVMGRHHQIVHSAVSAAGGWRPVDQGEGDAVFAAFDSPTAAVAAVVAFQRELADERWPAGIAVGVRVGVHTGEVIARNGNLFGATVNRCARLRGLGVGGQVLLSAPTWELVRDRLPEGVGVTDLGEHRMKDLTRPERVHQLVIPGLRSEFPPLASLARAQHNLPVQTSSFLGRDREVAELVDLVTRERLVTITGFGGMGKTRLALQVAAELAVGDGDGVWFVDLSNETDPDRVPSLIATTLGIGDGPDGTLPALLAALKNQRLLLVLDNLEQLLPQVALLVDRLARAGSRVRILATCREALRISGEHEYPLGPLALPEPVRPGAVLTEAEVGRLSTYAAVSLFLTRAAAARPDFTITRANAPAVAAICARLDGLPLALELAAARTRSMSPETLLPRLAHALKVLTGGDRSLPTRQRTLRATIAWSYDALERNEQQLLDRLSVFPGSFTLEAAEAICGPPIDDDADELDVLDVVELLVERSLLRHHPADGDQPEDRYSLLVSIGEYAAEHLEVAGHIELVQSRYADYYTNLVLLSRDDGQDERAVTRRLRREFHHLGRVADWHHDKGSVESDLVVSAWLISWLVLDGLDENARQLGERVLDRGGGSTQLRVSVMWSLILAAANTGRFDVARVWAARGLVEAGTEQDPSVLAHHLTAVIVVERSRAAVRSNLHRLLKLLDELPATGCLYTPSTVRFSLEINAPVMRFSDPGWAESTIRRRLGTDPDWENFYQSNLGFILSATNRPGEAVTALSRFEPAGGPVEWNMITRFNGLSLALDARIATGEYELAEADVDGLDRLAAEAGSVSRTASAQVARATLEHLTGRPAAALARLTTLVGLAGLSEEVRGPAELGLARLRRETGDTPAAARLLAHAWTGVSAEDAQHLTEILECLLEGATQALSSEPVLAAGMLGLVQAHRGPFRLSPFYDPDRLLTTVRDHLGDAAVDAIVADTGTRDLPEDPDWDAVVASLRASAHGTPEDRVDVFSAGVGARGRS